MRRAGPKLSKSCLNALIADGEVSKAEVEKTKQEILAAKNPAKQSPPVKQKGEEQKQKRTAVAKADDAPQATDARSRKEKKPVRETEVSQKTEKLTLNEQTFAALKQRQPKFIEEAAAEEMPKPRDPDKRARSSAAESASAKIDEPHAQHRTSAHKKKRQRNPKPKLRAVTKNRRRRSRQKKKNRGMQSEANVLPVNELREAATMTSRFRSHGNTISH